MSERSDFEALYEAHAGAVRGYLMRRGPADEADEVVAEVFMTAWRRQRDVPADARAWLLGVARNAQANLRRGSARRAALRARLEHERPAALAVNGHVEADVRDALLAMRERDRDALLLIAWEGLSSREAARALGVSQNTFDVRLHRAKKRLARALTHAEQHPSATTLRQESS